MPNVYIASPLGFNEPGRYWAAEVLYPALATAGWAVLDPWAGRDPAPSTTPWPCRPARPASRALRQMSRTIGARNRRLLAEATAVLAVLDGPDVDSGTAAEIGWAAARGTPVIGLRTDFRLAEHEAAPVNIQVEDSSSSPAERSSRLSTAAVAALAALPARLG